MTAHVALGDGDRDGEADVDEAGGRAEDDRAIDEDRGDDATIVGPSPEGWGAPTSTRDELGVDAEPSGSDPITNPSWRRSCDAPATCGLLPITKDEWMLSFAS